MSDLTPVTSLNDVTIVRKPFNAVRNEAERMRDLEIISSMYLRGKKPGEIAETLNAQFGYQELTAKRIQDDLYDLRQMWVKSALINYDQAKAREIARIDELEAESWVAWKKSWDKAVTEVSEDIEDKYGHKDDETDNREKKPSTYNRVRSMKTAKEGMGDPRYLDTIKWCIEERCKILGLHEPMRLAISWKEEAVKAGITDEDAELIYKKMVANTTNILRDKYLNDNTVDAIAKPVVEDSDDDFPDDID